MQEEDEEEEKEERELTAQEGEFIHMEVEEDENHKSGIIHIIN